MKQKICTSLHLCLLFLFSLAALAQNPGPRYEKNLEILMPVVSGQSQKPSRVEACAPRSNGNLLIGINKQLDDFELGDIPRGICGLAELTPQGDTVWVKYYQRAFQTQTEMRINFIRELPDGNFFVSGIVGEQYVISGFAWITDPSGNVLYRKNLEVQADPSNQYTYKPLHIVDIEVAPDGSIYYAGNYRDLFSGGVSYYEWTIAAYGKLSPTLEPVWTRIYGYNVSHSQANLNAGNVVGIKLHTNGNLIVVGMETNSTGNLNIAQVSPAGATVGSIRRRALYQGETPLGLVKAPSKELYLITNFSTLAIPTLGGTDIAINKFKEDGTFVWSKRIGSANSEVAKRVCFDVQSNTIVVAGQHTIGTQRNGWFAQFDTSGTALISKSFGNANQVEIFEDVCRNGSNFVLAGANSVLGGYLVQTDMQAMTTCTGITDVALSSAPITLPYNTSGVTHANVPARQGSYGTSMTTVRSQGLTNNNACFACSDQVYNINISACDSFFVAGAMQYASGVFTDTFPSQYAGCDSIIITNLTIYDEPQAAVAGPDQSVCGTSALLAADAPSAGTGTWTVIQGSGSFSNASSATAQVTGLAAGTNVLRWTVTNGSCSGSYDEVTIVTRQSTASTFTHTSCGPYTWINGVTYTSSTNTAKDTLVNAAGCDSVITLNLTVLQPSYATDVRTACESFTWINGVTYTASNNTATDTLVNAAGCDSVITLNLTIRHSTTSALNITSCDAYTLNGQTYTASGTYTQLLTNAAGCDSTLTLNLTIKNSTSSVLSATACDAYTLNGQTYTASGTYTQLLTNAAGCDSTLTLNLTIKNRTSSTLNITACDVYTLNGQTYTTSGTYTQLLTNAAGCDSTLTLNLTIKNRTSSTLNATACDVYTLNGQTYTASGTYTQLLTNAAGCDSTLTLNLVINHNSTSTLNATACESYTLNGQTYTSSGTYTQLLTNAAGCDSTLTLNLVINHNSASTLNATACESYTLNGQTYTSSGTYTQLLTNAAGCDSTLTLNLVINHNSTSTLSATACESYMLNGQTYTSSGTYTQLLTNAAGCDSTLTLNLVINHNSTSTLSATACESYTLNGQTYTSSGTYTQLLTNAAGCDSTLTLNLVINHNSTSTLNATACESYTLNGQTYTSSGTYTQLLTNAAGCDSTLTLNLTIKQVNTNVSQSANGIVLTASASGAQYQWMNCATGSTIDAATSQTFQAAQNGSYAVIVTQDGCTDTSACVTVSTVGLDESPGDLGLHAYPNPTDGMLNISSSFQGTAYVHIFDISGKMLQTVYMPDASAMKLDMSARLPGIYLLRVECGGHSSVIRIVRN